MTLVTSSSSSRFKIQVMLTACLIFIIYCIYTISNSIPPTQLSNNATTITIKDESTDDHSIANENKQIIDELPVIEIKKPTVCLADRVLRNTDPNHTSAHLDFWIHLSETTIEAYRQKWQNFISNIKYSNFPPTDMVGQGIVFVAGNRDTFKRTVTSIKLLRKYGCQLDIEVWHLNDEQPSDVMKQALKELNAIPRDLSNPNLVRPIMNRRDAEKQFQIKAAAVINSSFKEVLYLDSDNIPTRDPTFLFDIPGYKNTGALFWPDFWKTHGSNKIFDILDIPCQDEWEQESGQMVIDKEKSWLPLQLSWYMQKNYEIYFQFLNGDKDTFKYAWKALDIPYHMTEAFVGMAGTMVDGRFCGHTMLQYTPTSSLSPKSIDEEEDIILFVHANLLKITDKVHFIHDDKPEHPWDLAKHSTLSHFNTWIKPEFYISQFGQACMDFTHREGEPEATTENFDSLLPNFQKDYFKYGGIGGETRS